jgi:UDP-N-acetylmuramoylalanine--D-glutamate ligase
MKKELYQNEFKNKKITIMGLGLLGRGIKVTKFLAKCGANLTITDLKTEQELSKSLKELRKYKINYCLGKHQLSDFENVDMVVKSAGVPMDSIYIEHAKKNNVEIIMDASVFARIVKQKLPNTTIIGVTGTRGKSMTTTLIYHILKENQNKLKANVFVGGNLRGMATLPIIEKVKDGDFVVLELDSWQCQGFGDEKISPDIAVFTNLMEDHLNYYKNDMSVYLLDKCNIFKFQKEKDTLITNNQTVKIFPFKPTGKVICPTNKNVKDLKLKILGKHNETNASYAFEVAKKCGLKDSDIKKALKSFSGLEGRLQYLGKINGVHVINDNNSTTPQALVAGIKAVKDRFVGKNISLLAGGSNKNISLAEATKEIKRNCKNVYLLKGLGTDLLKTNLKNYKEFDDMKSALKELFEVTKKGDCILFSPGFASFGMFKNEYERNDKFLKIIESWK